VEHRFRTLAVLFIAVSLAAGCNSRRSPRNLDEAVALRDYESTLRFCEYYFERLPAQDPDPGQTRMIHQAYRKAFVQWSLARRGPLTRSAEKRIEKFRLYGVAASPPAPKGGK
jgi:hypothetical protein